MAKAILKTNFHFDGQKSLYEGKVRDVYNIEDRYLAIDRKSTRLNSSHIEESRMPSSA